MKKFVVTGIGRSGTKYTSELLTKIGIPCSWEKIFKVGTRNVNWTDPHGDSSWMAAPFLSKLPAGSVILHQTRDPLNWLNSWLKVTKKWGPNYTDFIDSYCGFYRWKDGYHPQTDMKTYVNWNDMIEAVGQDPKYTYIRYKVEDISPRTIMEISKLIDLPINQVSVFKNFMSVPKTVNASAIDTSYTAVTWDTLPECKELEDFKAMAIKFGYTVK